MHVHTFHCNHGVQREEKNDIAKVWALIAHRGRVEPSLVLESKRTLLVGLNQLVSNQGKGFESHSVSAEQMKKDLWKREQMKRSVRERQKNEKICGRETESYRTVQSQRDVLLQSHKGIFLQMLGGKTSPYLKANLHLELELLFFFFPF